jgi:hypothetical protein
VVAARVSALSIHPRVDAVLVNKLPLESVEVWMRATQTRGIETHMRVPDTHRSVRHTYAVERVVASLVCVRHTHVIAGRMRLSLCCNAHEVGTKILAQHKKECAHTPAGDTSMDTKHMRPNVLERVKRMCVGHINECVRHTWVGEIRDELEPPTTAAHVHLKHRVNQSSFVRIPVVACARVI